MLPSYNHTCMFMKVPRNWIENLEPACRCTEYETLKQASNSTQKSWAWRKRINPPSYKSVSSNYYLDIQHITQFDTWYIYEYTYLLESLSARINEVCYRCRLIKRLDFPGPNFSLYFLGYEVCVKLQRPMILIDESFCNNFLLTPLCLSFMYHEKTRAKFLNLEKMVIDELLWLAFSECCRHSHGSSWESGISVPM